MRFALGFVAWCIAAVGSAANAVKSCTSSGLPQDKQLRVLCKSIKYYEK